MDSQWLFGYGVTDAGLSYSSSYPVVPSIPNRLLGSLKFEVGNSPSLPFSSYFDCDTATTLGDIKEQHSSTDNLSEASASLYSPFEASSSINIHRLNPSLDSRQDSRPLICTSTSTLLQDTNTNQNIKNTLRQLETALMAPDGDEDMSTPEISLEQSSPPQASGQRTRGWRQEHQGFCVIPHQMSVVPNIHLQPTERARFEKHQKVMEEPPPQYVPSDLKQLLFACSKALAENNLTVFDNLIDKARTVVYISGEPIQRLGAYLVEGLVARKEVSGANIYRALRCREPESKDLLSCMQILYDICPYLKFGYMAANGAIAEACRNEDRIHIIDFQIAQGTQWMTLLQALAAMPSGAPYVRITGIDDPVSKYARGDGLEAVGRRLAAISKKFNIPVEFRGLPVYAPDVRREMLDVKPGEALVVNFPLQLHHTPDESVDVNNPRDGLIRMVRSLNPKMVTLVEQESNTNTTPFLTRFIETFDYYLAIFESIDVTLPRDRKERIGVEQHCLARDIVNVIACEGKEREERHELFGKWKSRFTMAGFKQYPLSSYVNSVIRRLLQCYSEHYTLVEKDGTMLLGWKDRNLISASAWH